MDRQSPPYDSCIRLRTVPQISSENAASARSIRVGYYSGSHSADNPGGGEIQLRKTAEYLRRLGMDVQVFDGAKSLGPSCDLVHVFGTTRAGLAVAREAKRRGVPVVLSTISWYDPWVSWRLEGTLFRRIRA